MFGACVQRSLYREFGKECITLVVFNCLENCQGRREQVWTQMKKMFSAPPTPFLPATVDRLKMFTLNQKD